MTSQSLENVREHDRRPDQVDESAIPGRTIQSFSPSFSGTRQPGGGPEVEALGGLWRVTAAILPATDRDRSRVALALIGDIEEGSRIVVDADIASFFDRLNHRVVMARVRRRLADGPVLNLIQAFLKAGIHENGVVCVPTEGTPQGGVISPWLANLVLDDLDKALEARGLRFVRYADDFVILCKTREEAGQAMGLIRAVLEELELELNEEKTSLTSDTQGFEFLGFLIRRGHVIARPKSIQRFKDRVRWLTRRQQGRNVDQVLQELNPLLRGWACYFGVADVTKQFLLLDSWVRMRIRAFKTKRRCRNDNIRLPNKRLAKWGLLSLNASRPDPWLSSTGV